MRLAHVSGQDIRLDVIKIDKDQPVEHISE
jgi:hypothetical protein